MIKRIVYLLLSLWLGPCGIATVYADTAIERMAQFFKQVNSMTADFSQSVIGENHSDPQVSQGILQMQRPGKFRWNYKLPYEQQIVADGTNLWVYDVEMEQVIVKPEELALGNTPAILLSGNAAIADKFTVTEISDIESTNKEVFWVQLLPKEQDTGFEKVLLGFVGDKLKFMELKDTFGQLTRLTFSNLKINQTIDSSVFKFKIPKGVDVIDETNAKQ